MFQGRLSTSTQEELAQMSSTVQSLPLQLRYSTSKREPKGDKNNSQSLKSRNEMSQAPTHHWYRCIATQPRCSSFGMHACSSSTCSTWLASRFITAPPPSPPFNTAIQNQYSQHFNPTSPGYQGSPLLEQPHPCDCSRCTHDPATHTNKLSVTFAFLLGTYFPTIATSCKSALHRRSTVKFNESHSRHQCSLQRMVAINQIVDAHWR
jgi:hypothetical protein